MSWLARSIANTLHLEDEDGPASPPPHPSDVGSPGDRLRDGATIPEEDHRSADGDDDYSYDSYHGGDGDQDGEDDNNQGRGVREDLSELKDTLTRQFWGVASFLAPPPPPPPPPPRPIHKSVLIRSESKSDWAESDNDYDDEEEELAECDRGHSGQFGEFSNLSRSEDNYNTNIIDDAIGITEEVLAFARNIAHHPETWLDFPLSEEEEFDDFEISDAQYKHALAVEQEAPRLAALRFELCPAHMSEGYFWTIYFVLLHSRLNKHDADLLSSPQIAQARSMWMKELQEKTKCESHLIGSTSHLKESSDYMHENFKPYEDTHSRYTDRTSPFDPSTPHERGDNENEKQLFCEVEYIDKSIIKEDPSPKPLEKDMVVGPCFEKRALDDDYDDDDDDDWLKEDSDLVGYSGSMIIGDEEDVSFSDLEDDIDYTTPLKSKPAVIESRTTTNTS